MTTTPETDRADIEARLAEEREALGIRPLLVGCLPADQAH